MNVGWHRCHLAPCKDAEGKERLCRWRPKSGLKLRDPPMPSFQQLGVAVPIYSENHHLSNVSPLLWGRRSGAGIFEWTLTIQWTIWFHYLCSVICRSAFACTHTHKIKHRWSPGPYVDKFILSDSSPGLPHAGLALSGTFTQPSALGLSHPSFTRQIEIPSKFWKIIHTETVRLVNPTPPVIFWTFVTLPHSSVTWDPTSLSSSTTSGIMAADFSTHIMATTAASQSLSSSDQFSTSPQSPTHGHFLDFSIGRNCAPCKPSISNAELAVHPSSTFHANTPSSTRLSLTEFSITFQLLLFFMKCHSLMS